MLRPEVFELPALAAFVVEVRRVEPRLERGTARGPPAVDDREPRVVAVASTPDVRLPERPLVGEAEPLRSTARRSVQAVALPFVAAIAQVVEGVPHHEVHRFG